MGDSSEVIHFCEVELYGELTQVCKYEFFKKSCVAGHNIEKFPDKTVEECKAICDARNDCKGIEYGVDYGGSSTTRDPRDCNLSSGTDTNGCDGVKCNQDFYE